MEEENEFDNEMHLTKGRLEGLSDGIFAFSMTLLVLGVDLPDKATIVQSNEYAIHVLLSLGSDFFHYVLAFLILGAIWLSHHTNFHFIWHVDKIFVWINLITLMFVALLPFSTSFSGDFPGASLGAIVFDANLFAISMGLFFQWLYATAGHRLVKPTVEALFIRRVRFRIFTIPIVALVGILLALAGFTWSSAVYMTLPLIKLGIGRVSVTLSGAEK
ncbi:TMEM175 family protein [Methanosphaerula palustris]|uniref:Integral membrane protein n=1 Tax=Methanosphaerula palustris (strain ATCC BAA-1556 / DSM 19958 / E1-9c) TaxID=521011 RepID=B8GFY1_METPE|nr:TMEM175 family protein [Methanosphaerula palustris]ACL18014.1 protein of unknown function DUF1211 [Methanosphaerula palustris E1-9c]